MNISKPKFWDKNKTFIFPILLLPITILIYLVGNYKKLFIKKHFFPIPIICIGNIYLGGTGKTPFSIKLFSILKNLKKNPAFIRKKYEAFQDEVKLQKKVGQIYENNKRAQAIKEAIKNKVDVAILDDGFQDFSINKNLSIICFNEKQWIGNGFLIPSGPLRESLSSLKRADYVIINGEKNINKRTDAEHRDKQLKRMVIKSIIYIVLYVMKKPNTMSQVIVVDHVYYHQKDWLKRGEFFPKLFK